MIIDRFVEGEFDQMVEEVVAEARNRSHLVELVLEKLDWEKDIVTLTWVRQVDFKIGDGEWRSTNMRISQESLETRDVFEWGGLDDEATLYTAAKEKLIEKVGFFQAVHMGLLDALRE